MNLLLYAGKVVICSGFLFGYYHLFLRNRKFHRYNRFYVLTAALFSILFPLFRIPVFQEVNANADTWIKSWQAISMSSWEAAFVVKASHTRPVSHFVSWQNTTVLIYTMGVICYSIPVLRSFVYIKMLSFKYKRETREGIAFYNTREPGTPFSFLQSIFWNEQLPLTSEKGQHILQHELFHIREKHSYDILFFQVLTNLFWFNPFFHASFKELKTIHEFLADEWAGAATNKYDYAELLVMEAMQEKTARISHQFFHHQIKRRIAMIIKQPTNVSYMSRIMTLPLLLALFSLFTLEIGCRDNVEAPSAPGTVNAANGGQKGGAHILPAQEFMSEVIKHMGRKEMSVAFRPDTILNLITAKFEDGSVIVTQLSEWKDLKLYKPELDQGIHPPVFSKVEIEAGFPGGASAWARYLNKNFHYPNEAQAKEIQGTVIVQFIVEVDGSVSDVKALSGPEGGLKEEAVRVIKASGNWEPAIQNGHKVASFKKQPVIFRLDA
ncbi:MAG: TonB family protein [Williamsia sp.]|nr:TonB family protein [Williamsia sp.]